MFYKIINSSDTITLHNVSYHSWLLNLIPKLVLIFSIFVSITVICLILLFALKRKNKINEYENKYFIIRMMRKYSIKLLFVNAFLAYFSLTIPFLTYGFLNRNDTKIESYYVMNSITEKYNNHFSNPSYAYKKIYNMISHKTLISTSDAFEMYNSQSYNGYSCVIKKTKINNQSYSFKLICK